MTEDERWAAAEAAAAVHPAGTAPEPADRWTLAVVLLVAVGVGIASGLGWSGPGWSGLGRAGPGDGGRAASWPLLPIGIGLLAAGALLGLAGLVRALVTGRVPFDWNRVDAALRPAQRRAARRAIRRREPAGPRRAALLTALAAQDRRSAAALAPVAAGGAVSLLGASLALGDLPLLAVPLLLGAVALAGAAVAGRRLGRQPPESGHRPRRG